LHVVPGAPQSRLQLALSSHAKAHVAPVAHVSVQSLDSRHSRLQEPVVHEKRHVSLSLHSQLVPHSRSAAGGFPVSSAPLSDAGLAPDEPDDESLDWSTEPVPIFQS
jgi:hypothetical protein